ncbi:MAG: hypothetical protein HFI41_11760 [Lachnospiraceae bacterium]|nr:hypothetical protein [Lachnospiraceae bacterium]
MTKILKKVSMLLAGSILSLSLFLNVGTTASASYQKPIIETQAENGISPLSDSIGWRVTMINGKLYKRQYNYSKGEWIGPWILVQGQA